MPKSLIGVFKVFLDHFIIESNNTNRSDGYKTKGKRCRSDEAKYSLDETMNIWKFRQAHVINSNTIDAFK